MKPLTKQPDYRFNLYVKGLAPTTTTRSLYELFKPYVFTYYYCWRKIIAIMPGDGIKRAWLINHQVSLFSLLLLLRSFVATYTVHVHACSDRYYV